MNRPTAAPIRSIVVGIPARDEEERILGCLESVLAAAAELAPDTARLVVVSCDSCTDATAEIVLRVAEQFPCVHVVEGTWGSAGGARRSAMAYGMRVVAERGDTRRDSVWLATTDADTHVPAAWLRQHLEHASAGADAVAGAVDLIDDRDRSPEVIELFRDTYELGRESHIHVHGANLGIRASAYLAVGGFPGVQVSEDHALWNALRHRLYRCVSPVDVRVSTSARLRGRAIGGFADTIAAALAP